MGMLKSRPITAPNVVGDMWSPEGGLMSKLPIVWEYLAAEGYEDGSTRTRSSLSVFVEGQAVKVALNDRDTDRSLYVTGATVEDALRSLEKALQSPRPDWRVWVKSKPKK